MSAAGPGSWTARGKESGRAVARGQDVRACQVEEQEVIIKIPRPEEIPFLGVLCPKLEGRTDIITEPQKCNFCTYVCVRSQSCLEAHIQIVAGSRQGVIFLLRDWARA
jgi:hypothetical protein